MFLTMDRRLAGERGAFFVQARAEELAPLGCAEGDYVLLEPTGVGDVAEGAVVAASIEGRPAYYRFKRNGQSVVLHPIVGQSGPTLVEDPSGLVLLGRITGIYRRMDHLPAAVTSVAH
jgi:SOS-response transcriptional repressor LexA